MDVQINKIYRYRKKGGVYQFVRVYKIDGEKITFTSFDYTEASNLEPALISGDIILYNRSEVTVVSAPLHIDEFSSVEIAFSDGKKECVNVFNEYSRPMFELIKSSTDTANHCEEIKDVPPIMKEMCDFFSETKYKFSPKVIQKIYSEWLNNKGRLYTILSKSPNWKENEMAIEWEIEIPNSRQKRNAKEIYESILRKYDCDFGFDYGRTKFLYDNFSYSDFFDIDKEQSEAFKSYGLKIQSGLKPTRAIRKFFEFIGATRIPDFDKLYAELTDLLSDKLLKRKMTLSIHPLDYLRMSNGNSWDSCHMIYPKKGCYHNGVQSYLMDGETMVCSLLDPESGEKTYLQPKINRMLFMLNNNGDILQSRLYPQVRNQELEDILAKEVNAKIAECYGIEDDYQVFVKDCGCNNYVESFGVHYRDYNCYNYGQRIWSITGEEPKRFTIGHISYCLICGEANDRNNSMICYDHDMDKYAYYDNLEYRCPATGNRYSRIDAQLKLNPSDGLYYSIWKICKHCGNVFFDNHVYCEECRKSQQIICSVCDEIAESYSLIEDEVVCDNCIEEHYSLCQECNEYHPNEEMRYIENKGYYCENCYDNYCSYCEDCDRYFLTDCTTYIENYGNVCDECYDEGDYIYCEECGYYYHIDDCVNIRGDYYCEDCVYSHFVICDCCGEYFYEEDITFIGDMRLCDDCVEENSERCSCCDELVYCDDIFNDSDGEPYCEECYDEHTETCTGCLDTYYEDKILYYEDDVPYCEECYSEMIDRLFVNADKSNAGKRYIMTQNYNDSHAGETAILEAETELCKIVRFTSITSDRIRLIPHSCMTEFSISIGDMVSYDENHSVGIVTSTTSCNGILSCIIDYNTPVMYKDCVKLEEEVFV